MTIGLFRVYHCSETGQTIRLVFRVYTLYGAYVRTELVCGVYWIFELFCKVLQQSECD